MDAVQTVHVAERVGAQRPLGVQGVQAPPGGEQVGPRATAPSASAGTRSARAAADGGRRSARVARSSTRSVAVKGSLGPWLQAMLVASRAEADVAAETSTAPGVRIGAVLSIADMPVPVRTLGLALRPERDLGEVLQADPRLGGAPTAWRCRVCEGEARLPEGVDPAARGVHGRGLRRRAGARRGRDDARRACALAAPHGVPVLGVNLGTLGYLTEIDAGHLEGALAALARGALHDRAPQRAGPGRPRRHRGPDRLQRRRAHARSGPRPGGAGPAASTASCSCATPATASSPPPRRARRPMPSPRAGRSCPRAPTG